MLTVSVVTASAVKAEAVPLPTSPIAMEPTASMVLLVGQAALARTTTRLATAEAPAATWSGRAALEKALIATGRAWLTS